MNQNFAGLKKHPCSRAHAVNASGIFVCVHVILYSIKTNFICISNPRQCPNLQFFCLEGIGLSRSGKGMSVRVQ